MARVSFTLCVHDASHMNSDGSFWAWRTAGFPLAVLDRLHTLAIATGITGEPSAGDRRVGGVCIHGDFAAVRAAG